MLRFSLFGFPIVIDWRFWLVSAFFSNGISLTGSFELPVVAIWVVMVLISLLAHELGHACMGKRFGARPTILLHGFGGSTYLPGGQFDRRRSILVSAAGPLASLALGMVIFGFARIQKLPPAWARIAIVDGIIINFYWSAFNLLPVQPLDGGQILRELIGPFRRRALYWIGGSVGAAAALWGLSTHQYYLCMMFALLAYHNFCGDSLQGGVQR